MKKILCLMSGVMLIMNLYGQPIAEHFLIGSKIPDLKIERILNYSDTVGSLSSFGNKLIIIDFWSKDCGPCIASFPRLDSIQRKLKDRVQFILITLDSKRDAITFLKKYNKRNPKHLTIPIVFGEIAIQQLFSHFGIPSLAFIEPNGRFIMQVSGEYLITESFIQKIINKEIGSQKRAKSHGTSMSKIIDKAPNSALLKRLKENKFIEMKYIYGQ